LGRSPHALPDHCFPHLRPLARIDSKSRLGPISTGPSNTTARLGRGAAGLLPPFVEASRCVGFARSPSLVAIGAIQFGLMYLAYFVSFRFLQSHEVALFTITTPIFVTLFADALARRFHSLGLGRRPAGRLPAPPSSPPGQADSKLTLAGFGDDAVVESRLRDRAGALPAVCVNARPKLHDRGIFGLLLRRRLCRGSDPPLLTRHVTVTPYRDAPADACLPWRDRIRNRILSLEYRRHARGHRHARRHEQFEDSLDDCRLPAGFWRTPPISHGCSRVLAVMIGAVWLAGTQNKSLVTRWPSLGGRVALTGLFPSDDSFCCRRDG